MRFLALLLMTALGLTACSNAIPNLGSLGLSSSQFSLSQGTNSSTSQIKMNATTHQATFNVSCLSTMTSLQVSYDQTTWSTVQPIDCSQSPVSVTMTPTVSTNSVSTITATPTPGNGTIQQLWLRATGPNGIQTSPFAAMFVEPVFSSPSFAVTPAPSGAPQGTMGFSPNEIAGSLSLTPDYVYIGSATCPTTYSETTAGWISFPPPPNTPHTLLPGSNTFYVAYADSAGNVSTCVHQVVPYSTPPPSTPVPSTPVPSTPVPSTPVPSTPVPSTPVPSTPVPSITPITVLSVVGPSDRANFAGETFDFAVNWSAPVTNVNSISLNLVQPSTTAQLENLVYNPSRSTPLTSIFTAATTHQSATGVEIYGALTTGGLPVGVDGQPVDLSTFPTQVYSGFIPFSSAAPVVQFDSVNSLLLTAGTANASLTLTISPVPTAAITVSYRFTPNGGTTTSIPADIGDTGAVHTFVVDAGQSTHTLSIPMASNLAHSGFHGGTVELVNANPARLGSNITKDIYFDTGGSSAATVTQMAVDLTHGCAVSSSGVLQCWGMNLDGEIGTGAASDNGSIAPTVINVGTNLSVTKVAVGQLETCAITSNNALYCWGSNATNQISGTSTSYFSTPQLIALSNVTDVSLGTDFTCAIYGGGLLKCWGLNQNYQLGLGSTSVTTALSALNAPLLTGVTKITTGALHACAISNNSMLCWGDNSYGQIGFGSTLSVPSPTVPPGLSATQFSDLGADDHATCALSSSGGSSVYCTGPAVENGTSTSTKAFATIGLPTTGPSFTHFLSSSQSSHMCLNRSTGASYCWGIADSGAFYDSSTRSTGPMALAQAFSAFAVGPFFSCYIDTGFAGPQCGGAVPDYYPQLYHSHFYTQVTGINRQILQLSSAMNSTTDSHHSDGCAINGASDTTSGSLECFGSSPGNGVASTNSPVQVFGSGISKVAKGGDFTCALRATDHELLCWGQNTQGQLGSGQTDSTPVLLPQLTLGGVANVVATNESVCAVMGVDGSLECWGSNTYGAVGNGSTVNVVSPTKIPGLTGVTQIVAGLHHVCAVWGISNSISCWGANTFGQVTGTTGTVVTTPQLLASSVIGTSQISQIVAGSVHTCTLSQDHSVHCWGDNSSSQISDGGLPTSPTGIYASLRTTCVTTATQAICWGEWPLVNNGSGSFALTFATFSKLLISNGTICATTGPTLACVGIPSDLIFTPTDPAATNSGTDQGLGFGPAGQRPLLGMTVQ